MPDWNPLPAPTWVGRIERNTTVAPIAVDGRYATARLVVTAAGVPIGTVEVALSGGRAGAAEVAAAVQRELGAIPDPPAPATSTQPVTVVIATRGRPASLARCVRAVLAGDHPDVTVLVVDNDPVDDRTAAAVRAVGDHRVRYIREPRRGASVGRNRGLREATTPIVAFTDDDTEPDRAWASRIAGAFAADPALACVSGPVLAARLGTVEELAADAALGWNTGFSPRRFTLADPPADSPIFPFSPGLFGIGANLAVRAATARAVGGFDEALGPGTASRAAEDCEFLVRMVLAGHVLGFEPGAFVWHRHRTGSDALREQLSGYAVGLGAFLTKIACDPRARSAALRRLPAALAAMRRIGERESGTATGMPMPDGMTAARLRGLVSAPMAYRRARRAAEQAGGAVPPLVVPATVVHEVLVPHQRGASPEPALTPLRDPAAAWERSPMRVGDPERRSRRTPAGLG